MGTTLMEYCFFSPPGDLNLNGMKICPLGTRHLLLQYHCKCIVCMVSQTYQEQFSQGEYQETPSIMLRKVSERELIEVVLGLNQGPMKPVFRLSCTPVAFSSHITLMRTKSGKSLEGAGEGGASSFLSSAPTLKSQGACYCDQSSHI